MDFEFFEGQGDFVFFLHGWGGNKNSFKLVLGHLKNNLVFVTMSGFDAPQKKPLSVFDYASEIKDLVVRLAKGKAVTIVCHSFGARVAAIVAAENPSLVKKLVIVDGAGIKPRFSLKKFLKIRAYKRAKRKAEMGKLEKTELEKFGSSDYKALCPVMRQTFVWVVRQNILPFFKKIRAKTLILWGSNDKETPLYMAKKIHRAIEGSEMFVIRGAGHFSYLERPDIFLAALKCFV